MPVIKPYGSNQDKKKINIQGKPATNGDGRDGAKAFLSVAPAPGLGLPVLHAPLGGRAPRLAKRSHSSVGAGWGGAGVGDSPDDGDLQHTHDGRVQVTRTQKEKEKNPDRISLDRADSGSDLSDLCRRGLTAVPLMAGETRVRLLSLQHNLISRLDSLATAGLALSRLVFLDIYDNEVDRISGLESLDNLRVLLMGKNRIRKIEGLRKQVRLEVLDLHGNQITGVSGLSFLMELKVLNLAGNQIRSIGVSDLQGMRHLQELNLRRNKLKKLLGFGDVPHLVKLFLSNNELACVEDMYSVAKAVQLREVTIDGNPVAQGGDCVSFLVSYLPNLMVLSNVQITDPVRKAALAWRSNKEASSSLFLQLGAEPEGTGIVKREEVIFNARTNWELQRSQSCYGPGSGATGAGAGAGAGGNGGTGAGVIQVQEGDARDAPTDTPSQPTTPNMRISRPLKPGMVGPSARVVSMVDRPDNKRKTFIRRTASQDTDISQATSSTNTSNSVEFFRLPPILAPLLGFPEEEHSGAHLTRTSTTPSTVTTVSGTTSSVTMTTASSRKPKRCDSLSSVEPNVDDSSLSSLPSETSGDEESGDSSAEGNNSGVVVGERPGVSTQQSVIGTVPLEQPPTRTKSAISQPVHRRPTPQQPPRASTARALKNRGMSLSTAAVVSPTTSSVPSQLPTAPPQQLRPASPQQSTQVQPKTREQGGDYLVEINGRYLNVYGQGALRFIDRPWNSAKAADVTIVRFNYINFNGLTTVLGRLKQRFPNAEHFIFRETNISCLGQLNALADIQGLTSLTVEEEGNPIVKKQWQSYAIYRLAHWGLRTINDEEVTEEMIASAAEQFRGLSDLVLWSLPDSLLQPLLSRLRLDGGRCPPAPTSGSGLGPGHGLSARQWLWTADPALRSVVGKEALQWRRTALSPEDLAWRHKGRAQLGALLDLAVAAVRKLRVLEAEWPVVLQDLVRDTLVDYSHLHTYMKKCMANLQRL